MPDTKVTDLAAIGAVADTDVFYIADVSEGAAGSKKITKANLQAALSPFASALVVGSVPFATATDKLDDDNTNLFYDNSLKRFGFGTNTPSELVEIKKIGGGIALAARSGSATDQINISMGRTSDEWRFGIVGIAGEFFTGTAVGDGVIRLDDEAKRMHIGVSAAGASAEFVIMNGAVGIGTSTPTDILEVVKSNGTAISTLSGDATKFTRIGVGRTALEVSYAIIGNTNEFFTGTAAGDAVVRLDSSSKKIHLGVGVSGSAELVIADGNVGFGVGAFGASAVGVIGIVNGTAPTTSPAGMGQLYVESGALKYRGSSGTITTLGVA